MQIPARVESIDHKKVTFDLNHPPAGRSLIFKIEVIGISNTATPLPFFPSFPGSTGESRENGRPARFSFHRLHLLSEPHLPSPYPAYIPRQRKAEKSQEPGEKENPLNADPVRERRCNQHREQSHGNEKGRG